MNPFTGGGTVGAALPLVIGLAIGFLLGIGLIVNLVRALTTREVIQTEPSEANSGCIGIMIALVFVVGMMWLLSSL